MAGGVGRSGPDRLLSVGRGGSGRGPARSVVHRRSFPVPVRGRGGGFAAIVPWGGPRVTGGDRRIPSIVRRTWEDRRLRGRLTA
ncbi:hypothetical protein STXM2123_5619 [Streptomyces sp. F-3]|nr:hypothetical protein STXM2123_5619 [Streptomyces sp. F-3]